MSVKASDKLPEGQDGSKQAAVAITSNCSIQSGAVKYTEQESDDRIRDRRLSPGMSDGSDDGDDDDEDDDLLLIEDEVSIATVMLLKSHN